MPQLDTEGGDAAVGNEVVLGVDTHKDVHVAALITMVDVLLASKSFPATAAGYAQLLTWVRTFGTVRQAGVKCSGSYGAALTRYLHAQRVSVIEINPARPSHSTQTRQDRRC